MKIEYAFLSHTTIGFPKVILKFHQAANGAYVEPYVTVKGLVGPWDWFMGAKTVYSAGIEKELERFDEYVRIKYRNDASVQG